MSDHPGAKPSHWVQELSGHSVCILTYGCTFNEGDTDRLSQILTSAGCSIVSSPNEADVVVLNSCIVIDKTERKMVRLMRDLAEKPLWVMGCLPTARPDILSAFPHVRVILPDDLYGMDNPHYPASSGGIAVVQIGPGCLGECRYCITRLARGKIRSIPEGDILSQIQHAVKNGAYEIRLCGQDISAYGWDHGGSALPSLLHRIRTIPGSFKVRLGMMNPATLAPVAREVAEELCDDKFYSFVHLPIQSGSDDVLARMNRGYTVAEYLQLISIMRAFLPGISIATDIIAGYGDESEEEFRETVSLLHTLAPDMINVTRYSFRPGSSASRDGELPDRIRKDRSRELIRVGYGILKEKKAALIGTMMEVLITEELRPGSVMGRAENYLGVVIAETLPIGSSHLVEITGERTHYLIGSVCSGPW